MAKYSEKAEETSQKKKGKKDEEKSFFFSLFRGYSPALSSRSFE